MPSWISRLEELYASGAACQFIVHGNVQDVFWHAPAEARGGLVPPGEAARGAGAVARSPSSDYLDLDSFLVRRLLGGFSVILEVDLAHGIEVHRGRELLEGWEGLHDLRELRDSPKAYLTTLRQLFLFLHNRAVGERRSAHVAAILRDAQLLVPGEASNVYFDLGASATLVRDWSRPGTHEWFSLTTFLLAENLADLHPIVRSNPLAASLEVTLPDEAELTEDLQRLAPSFADTMGAFAGKPDVLARKLRGLTRNALASLLRRRAHAKHPLDAAAVGALRKELVERDCSGLVEFVESNTTLDDFHGQPQLVEAVRTDLKLMREGVTKAVPMGYLVTGPVGTGKTYLVNCLAGEAGIPVIVLKNFRDRWVGSSEANLEKISRLIGAVGECVVFIDEADQTLGRRNSGDSSSDINGRLYSMLAQFMANQANRGRVLWVLATSRPDLVEVDLKRPGRVDRRLPVLPAMTREDAVGLMRGVFQRFGLELPAFSEFPADLDLPELLTAGATTALASAVYRQFHLTQRPPIDLLREQLANYLPPVPVSRIREQIKLAIADASDLALLPESLRKELAPK